MSDEKQVEQVEPKKDAMPQRAGYSFMGLTSKEFQEINPHELPPMLRKVHAKHLKAGRKQ